MGDVVDICSGKDYKHLKKALIPVRRTGEYMLSVNEAFSYSDDTIGIGSSTEQKVIGKYFIQVNYLITLHWRKQYEFKNILQKENFMGFFLTCRCLL